MIRLGPRLRGAKFAAFVLAIYATIYAGLLLFLVVGSASRHIEVVLPLFGLFALAATPFLALIHLARATDKNASPPTRPKIMALVMAVPTVFWFYTSYETIPPSGGMNVEQSAAFLAFLAMPAFLSMWLFYTFVLLALQGGVPATSVAHDIE